jgi:AcrR family transcriptional regulator
MARKRENQNSDFRRREVIEAVSDLIADHGIDGTSMRQLAAAAGLSTGTINYHFKNKRALMIAALDAVYVLPANWEQHRDEPALQQLRILTRQFVLRSKWLKKWWRFWVEYMAHAGRDDELRARQEERYRRQRRFYSRVVARGVASGELRPAVDAEEVADTFLALANGLAVHQVAIGSSISPNRAEEILLDFVESLANTSEGVRRG